MATHGLLPNGKCTCGSTHTDPKDIAKHPATSHGQDDATSDAATINGWWHTNEWFNIGVYAAKSGFFVLDVDPRNGGYESLQKLEELIEGEYFADGYTQTVTSITGVYSQGNRDVRGMHLYIKAPDGLNLQGKLRDLPGIDIKHKGYVLLPPSRHISGVEYSWADGKAPWDVPIAEPSEKLLALISKNSMRSTAASSTSTGTVRSVIGRSSWDWVNGIEWQGEKLDLERFWQEGISEGSRAVDLYAMACSMANKYGTDPMARSFIETQMIRFNHEMVRPPLEVEGQGGLMQHVHRAIDFVAANPKDSARFSAAGTDAERKVVYDATKNLGNAGARAKTYEHLVGDQPVFGTSDPDDVEVDEFVLPTVSLSNDVDALTAEDGGSMGHRTMTDLGNGRRLVDAFGSQVRYTAGLGWFHWNQQYWKPDTEELEIRELTKRLGSMISAEASEFQEAEERAPYLKWAKQAKSNARQSAAIESAQSDPRVGVDVDNWDADPYLLGVANGVIDLRTGALLKGRPDLHITRRAPVAYTPGIQSPRFLEFLNYATFGDKEYQEWLQKAIGYTLTGLRTYDVMFLVYGPPGSGKNTFVETIVKGLGTKQYAFPLDSQILAQGDGRANASDQYYWAELRGRRMIWVDELPESERMKENSVKKLTGSSEIPARSPGEKPFTFQSQGKLWITTNHRPIITDDAMWRRMRPIPWMNVPTNSDPTLKEYLHDYEGGLPGMMSWAVEGAMKLLASKEPDALGWCSVVADAAEVYRRNEDRLGLFLEDETSETGPTSSEHLKTIYSVYKTWSEDRGERPMTQIAFQRKISDRGIQVSGSGGNAQVLGRTLKQQPKPVSHSSGDWGFVNRMGRDD